MKTIIRLLENASVLNRTLITAAILLSHSLSCFAQKGELIPVADENGKWGFVDKNGKMVVSCKFDWVCTGLEVDEIPGVEPNEVICVQVADNYGFIDRTGKEIVPCEYFVPDIVVGKCFIGGIQRVEKDDKWGAYDIQGKLVVPFEYDKMGLLSEGLMYVVKKGKYGFVDKHGKKVIPFRYDFAYPFCDGLAAVIVRDKLGFINKNGQVVIPCVYELYNEDFYGCFDNGKLVVKKNGKYGVIDNRGKVVLPCIYERIDISGELFEICKDGKWYYVDENGKKHAR